MAKYGAAPHFTTHIDVLHKTENIALARIGYERNAADKDGVDYHSLIKMDGEWKVISKLFQTSEKRSGLSLPGREVHFRQHDGGGS